MAKLKLTRLIYRRLRGVVCAPAIDFIYTVLLGPSDQYERVLNQVESKFLTRDEQMSLLES